MEFKSILLIITGSVAAYKSLELIRNLRKKGVEVDVILTHAAQQFITPLQVSSLTGRETYSELFSLKDEVEMGHIQLSRKADAIVIAPATADIMAKMASGQCDDLATTALLATNKPVMIAPAMNHRMWHHAATQRNVAQLKADGITIIEPTEGEMACGEQGIGRMAEPETILAAILPSAAKLPPQSSNPTSQTPNPTLRALITAGPTHEPIDPVRYIANHSSGKQGIAIAKALADSGAAVTLILGPTNETVPENINVQRVTTAREMFSAVKEAENIDVAIACAAVADWQVEASSQKLKKGESLPELKLTPNPDILKWMAKESPNRAKLVIGFAAETENVQANAKAKLKRKGCDWLVANDVSEGKVFGSLHTQVTLLPDGESWQGSKQQIAENLAQKIHHYFTEHQAERISS